jgi:hypothetical protein
MVVTQHGRAVAVLVDPQTWNEFLGELETWQDSFAALEAKYQAATGQDAYPRTTAPLTAA